MADPWVSLTDCEVRHESGAFLGWVYPIGGGWGATPFSGMCDPHPETFETAEAAAEWLWRTMTREESDDG